MTAAKFKSLTCDNLLEPDPLTTAFANTLDLVTGDMREMTRDERNLSKRPGRDVLRPFLLPAVHVGI